MRHMVLASAVAALLGGLVAAPAAGGGAVMPFDFDGDGYADLAVSVTGEDLRGVKDAGAVQVLYGSASGPTARDQLWHQGLKGVKGVLEKNDRFGRALASGDFDADGYADLAIGTPGEDVRSIRDAGSVKVLYGGPGGLTLRDQAWHQGSPGVPGGNEAGDGFGNALAAGDLDGDGYADLAVGVSGEDVGTVDDAGRVVVLRGTAGGLRSAGSQTLRQGRNGVASQPAQREKFGAGLAVGDVNGDGLDDLAVQATREADSPLIEGSQGVPLHTAAFHVMFGDPGGLTTQPSQFFLAADLTDQGYWPCCAPMGFADFDSDGRADLALGADDFAAVLHGHTDGLHPAALPSVAGVAPGVDALWLGIGTGDEAVSGELAVGDITGDGYPDLVGQQPGEVGGAAVVLGTAEGLSPTARTWAVPGAEYGHYGILPLSGGTHAWLVVEADSVLPDYAGAVAVLQGTLAGDPGPVTVWSQDSPGIKGVAEPYDAFGGHIGH